MTYKDWLYTLILGGNGSSSGSGEGESSEPLIVQTNQKIEQESGDVVLELNKTNKEIYDAFMSNKKVLLYSSIEDDVIRRKQIASLTRIIQQDQVYYFTFEGIFKPFQGENEDGYATNGNIK